MTAKLNASEWPNVSMFHYFLFSVRDQCVFSLNRLMSVRTSCVCCSVFITYGSFICVVQRLDMFKVSYCVYRTNIITATQHTVSSINNILWLPLRICAAPSFKCNELFIDYSEDECVQRRLHERAIKPPCRKFCCLCILINAVLWLICKGRWVSLLQITKIMIFI